MYQVEAYLTVVDRMESVTFRSSSSQAKVLGAIVSISGAFLVTLYKGPRIISTPPSSSSSVPQLLSSSNSNSNWVLGGLFLTTEYILVPMWYIVQVLLLLVAFPPNSKSFLRVICEYLSHFAGANHEGISCRTKSGILLQLNCEHTSWNCGFDYRTGFECLET